MHAGQDPLSSVHTGQGTPSSGHADRVLQALCMREQGPPSSVHTDRVPQALCTQTGSSELVRFDLRSGCHSGRHRPPPPSTRPGCP